MAALISSVMDTKDKVPFFVNQAEAMGIEILPPDVNESDHEFMVVDGNIRFGLDAVKGVGYAAVEAIKRAREEDGPFTSLWDFCERVDGRTVNKRSIEALIKCGAFGSTGATRKGMLEVLDAAQAAGQKCPAGRADRPGLDLRPARGFGDAPRAFAAPSHPPIPTTSSSAPSCWRWRRSRSASSSPSTRSSACARRCRSRPTARPPQVMDQRDGEWVKVGGMITESQEDPHPQRGSTMMFATLDDLEGAGRDRGLREGARRRRGRDRRRRDRARARPRRPQGGRQGLRRSSRTSTKFEPTDAEIEKAKAQVAKMAAHAAPKALCRRVDAAQLPATVIDDLRELFERYPGETEFVLEMHTRTGLRRLKFGDGLPGRRPQRRPEGRARPPAGRGATPTGAGRARRRRRG